MDSGHSAMCEPSSGTGETHSRYISLLNKMAEGHQEPKMIYFLFLHSRKHKSKLPSPLQNLPWMVLKGQTKFQPE